MSDFFFKTVPFYRDVADTPISQNTPLILVEEPDDFEIVGGGSFGEVIEEDDENN